MCLAIYRPAGVTAAIAPTIDELETSDFNGNGDSVGVVWRADGRLRMWRQVKPKSMHALHGLLCSLGKAGYGYAAHMRLATHGSITAENAHPIPMGPDAAIVHNGVLPYLWSKSKDKCDTVAFAEWANGNLPEAWWVQSWIVNLLESTIGWNKIIIMSRNYGDKILNEDMGQWENGLWFSNDSHKPDVKALTSLVSQGWEGSWRKGRATVPVHSRVTTLAERRETITTSGDPAIGAWTREGGDVCLRCADEFRDEIGGPIFREDIEGDETVCDVCGDVL